MAEFITAKEAAEICRVSEKTIKNYILKGKLKALKIGRQYRIDKEEFKNFLIESEVKKES